MLSSAEIKTMVKNINKVLLHRITDTKTPNDTPPPTT